MMLFKYSKYPNAAKAYLRFMMEKEQYEPWQQASIGYVVPPAQGLRDEPDLDIRIRSTRRTATRMKIMLPNGYAGRWATRRPRRWRTSSWSNMVAEAASGSKTPKEATERAQKRAERYYKV